MSLPADPTVAARERTLAEHVRTTGLVAERVGVFLRRFPDAATNAGDFLSAADEAVARLIRAFAGDFTKEPSRFASYFRTGIDRALIDVGRADQRLNRIALAAYERAATLLAEHAGERGNAMRRLQALADVTCDSGAGAMTVEACCGGEEDAHERHEFVRAMAILEEAVATLPEPQRALAANFFRGKKTLVAMAAEMRIHPNTAERWLKQALETLRKTFVKHGIKQAPRRAGAPDVPVLDNVVAFNPKKRRR